MLFASLAVIEVGAFRLHGGYFPWGSLAIGVKDRRVFLVSSTDAYFSGVIVIELSVVASCM